MRVAVKAAGLTLAIVFLGGVAPAPATNWWYCYALNDSSQLLLSPLFEAPEDYLDEAKIGFARGLRNSELEYDLPILCLNYATRSETEARSNDTYDHYVGRLGYSVYEANVVR